MRGPFSDRKIKYVAGNASPSKKTNAPSLSPRLKDRLLAFVFDHGARRAWLDTGGNYPRLCGEDGNGQPFRVEISGSQREWLQACEELTGDTFAEPENAGVLRFVAATRFQPGDAHARPVRYGEHRQSPPSSGTPAAAAVGRRL